MKVLPHEAEKLLIRLRMFKPKPFNVAVMPDFFLDRFISWNGDIKQFSRKMHEVVDRKGGSIDNVGQMQVRGGNAVNTAAALAVLGANVFPIVQTSKLGLKLLELYLQPLHVDLSYAKTEGNPSITTALEFTHKGDKRNVMLRDLGSLAKFSPNDLGERDFALLERADYVCVFNWAGTRKHGTELARKVFHYVKAQGRGKTYYDTADPLPNKSKISELVREVLLEHNLVDILSLNENEAITYARHVAPKQTRQLQKQHKSMSTLAKQCAKILAQKSTSQIDLHATTYSATITKNGETTVPTFKARTLRATGAGDAWNAGNIYADANNFPADLRLTFANAVAAYYLSSPKCTHPQLPQLRRFLQKTLHERKQ